MSAVLSSHPSPAPAGASAPPEVDAPVAARRPLPASGRPPAGGAPARTAATTVVDVVLPVHNEVRILAAAVTQLHTHLRDTFPFSWRITIVDGASTDGTGSLADDLAAVHQRVEVVHLHEAGHGRAIRAAWRRSDATILVAMDLHRPADLGVLLPLVAPLLTGRSDLAVGSRLSGSKGSAGSTARTAVGRRIGTRAHAAALRLLLPTTVRDPGCRLVAVRADLARDLLDDVRDDSDFFEAELVVRAEGGAHRVAELPIDPAQDPGHLDPRRSIVRAAIDELVGAVRVSAGSRARSATTAVATVLATVAAFVLALAATGQVIGPSQVAALVVAAAVARVARSRISSMRRRPTRSAHPVRPKDPDPAPG